MKILIPAFEPTIKLIDLVYDLRKNTEYGIIVVDDGSGLKYREIFDTVRELGCTVLYHKANKGKGEALKTGFRYMIDKNIEDSVVCADCDGQHHLEDIIKIANHIESGKEQLVLGVRGFNGKVPIKSKLGNTATVGLFTLLTGVKIADTQTGLRGYPSSIISWLCTVEGSRYEYELNIILHAKEAGVSIKQIPIKTIYENNNKGTHFRPIADSARIYLPLIKFGGSSIICGLIDFILLLILQSITANLLLSVVAARECSSITNYTLNRRLVFKNNKNISTSAPKYFSLVILIIGFNYMLMAALTRFLLLPIMVAKIITEIVLFYISYTIQRKHVFA